MFIINKKQIRYIVLNPSRYLASVEDNLGIISKGLATNLFKDNQLSKINSTILTFQTSKEKKYEMSSGNNEFYIREDGSLIKKY